MGKSIRIPYINVKQRDYNFYLAKILAKHLVVISYVSVRGLNEEPGAVQRFLNQRRIASIKEFTQSHSAFPASIILNWIKSEEPILEEDGELVIPLEKGSAQLIDGQHRLAGIEEAIKDDPEIGELEIPIAIYNGLETKKCANIFLSINTEQKPVPRSLVFDLYQLADEEVIDPAASRARDIVESLNSDSESAYHGEIKTPGTKRRKGGIQLSTAVTAIKPLVEQKGDLEQVGALGLETQKAIIKNFFHVLRRRYGEIWSEKQNAFMYASGFQGGIQFLRLRMIPYCNSRRDFTFETMDKSIVMDQDTLIMQDEVKGKQGKEGPRIIFELLDGVFEPIEQVNEIKV